MDSGNNIVEKNDELEILDDVVATDSEETGQPQAGDNDNELFVETEDDQHETSKNKMSEKQLTAAFKEGRAKWKKSRAHNAELNEKNNGLSEENAALKKRLDKIEAQVSIVSNPRPKAADFIDAEDFDQALSSWDKSKQTKQDEQPKKSQTQVIDNKSAYQLYEAEEEVKKLLPDYDDAKSAVEEILVENNIANTDLAFAIINKVSQDAGCNPAKAIYAFSKTPDLMKQLIAAGNVNDGGLAVTKLVKKAAGKVKTRKKVVIDSEPEPDIKSKGSIDSINQQLKAAKDAYHKDPTNMKKSNNYFDLKKKVKKNV